MNVDMSEISICKMLIYGRHFDFNKLSCCVFQQTHDGSAGYALRQVPPEPVRSHYWAHHHQQKPRQVQTQRFDRSSRGREDLTETQRTGG